MREQGFSFTRYLAAKRSIDDHSLNRYVWNTLCSMLNQNTVSSPMRVTELGAGIGTMLHRVIEWQFSASDMIYTAIDNDTESLRQLWADLPGWADQHSIKIKPQTENSAQLRLSNRQTINLMTKVADINALPVSITDLDQADVLIAHAVLDLLNIQQILPDLLSMIKPNGFYYFTLAFDGMTVFEPAIDPEIDSLIERLYHQTMDHRRVGDVKSGDSQSGRHLLNFLNQLDVSVCAAGASDWVVMPVQGDYQASDAYFLRCILQMMADSLGGNPEIDREILADWIRERHQQIERRELIYIAHQIDVCGQQMNTK